MYSLFLRTDTWNQRLEKTNWYHDVQLGNPGRKSVRKFWSVQTYVDLPRIASELIYITEENGVLVLKKLLRQRSNLLHEVP